jgi:molecular chaperone GrpE
MSSNENENMDQDGYVNQQEDHEDKGSQKKDKKRKADHAEELNRQWQEKYDELNDRYLRLYSEFDNYRKRTQKERIDYLKNASEEMILALLPVMDDLERALAMALKTDEGTEVIPKEGLNLIYLKFKGLLTQKGLEYIPSMGETFDVDIHDAVTNIPAPSDDLKGKVVDEIQKGYKLNGKVIRYSKVIIGN